jgi:hypothetical protein
MSDVVFQGNSDFSQVERDFGKLAQQNVKLLEKIKNMATANNKAAAEDRRNRQQQQQLAREAAQQQQQLAKEAASIMERSRTPVQKYRDELAKIREHLKQNRISAKAYRTEKARIVAQYQKETNVVKAAKGSHEQLQNALKEQLATLNRLTIGSAAWQEQKRKVDALKQSVDRANASMNQSNEQQTTLGQRLGAFKMHALAAVGAGMAMVNMLKRVAEASREAREAVSDTAVDVDTMSRRMQVQSGLTDEQAKQRELQILNVAKDRGVTAEYAFSAATQAVSSGFNDPVNSGILEEFLKTAQATNFDGDPKELVKSVSQMLNSFGEEKSLENVQRLTTAMQAQFKNSETQLSDMSDLAKNGAIFKAAGFSMEEAVASGGVLKDILPSAEAATGLRNFTVLSATATQNGKKSSDALAELGLKQTDVDFIGESVIEVATRYAEALKNVAPERKNILMANIFGRENMGSAGAFIANADRIQSFLDVQGNREQFEKDADIMANSKQAKLNQFELEEQIRASKGAGDAAFGRVIDARQRDQVFDVRRDELLQQEHGVLNSLEQFANRLNRQTTEIGSDVGLSGWGLTAFRSAIGVQGIEQYQQRLDPAAQQNAEQQLQALNEIRDGINQLNGNRGQMVNAGAAAARKNNQGEGR